MSTPLRERPDAPLGTLIFRAGLLPAETIENALEEGVKTGRRLGEILVERNLIKEEDLTRLLAGQKGLPFVSLRERSIEPDAARLLSEDQARLFTALPIGFEEGVPVVAVADPTNDVLNRNIREALGQETRFIVVARSELNDVIGEIFSGAYEAAPAAPEPEPQPLRVDTSVPPTEPELPADEFEAEPEPALEAEQTIEAAPEQEAEPHFDASEYDFDAPVESESEPEPAFEPEPEPAFEPEPEPEALPEPVMEAAPELPAPAFEAPAFEAPAFEAPAFEAPAPAPEPEAEPELAPLATEPVAPQSLPQSNGQVHEAFEDDTPPQAAAPGAAYRVSIRLTSGERVIVAECEDIGEAKGYAKAVTRQIGSTDSDDWPFVNGRFLKPDTIVSVDVEEL
jgi:Type II secretion system (T2SS), protein E, N-terminal domain